MKNRAFFLDRDGTLNVDYNFVHTKEEWTWCDGAVESIRWMNEHEFKVIVVTNQSGIARGRFTEQQVNELHNWVDEELAKKGLHIDLWLLAPHHPKFDPAPYNFPPEDRKPNTGMFKKADNEFDIDFSRSYMAGDKLTDLKPAVELGIKPIFIRSRHEKNQDKEWLLKHGIDEFDRLWDAVRTIG